VSGAGAVWEDLKNSNERNIYYWYYATQLLHNMQNKAWKQWNPKVRDGLVARGSLSEADVDRYLELVGSSALDLATAPLVSAWGRRPAD